MTFSHCNDNEVVKPQISFQSAASTGSEGESVTVLFNIPLPNGVTPLFTLGGTATQGIDYEYTIAATGLVFNLKEDGVQDPDETIIITLTGFNGNAQLGPVTVHTLTIHEPPLVVEFNAPVSAASEGTIHTVAFKKVLPAGVEVTVELEGTATEGEDYTYSIASDGVTLTLVQDESYDPDETVIIHLKTVTGNAELGETIIHTVTITEPPVVLAFESASSSVNEGEDHFVAYSVVLPEDVVPTLELKGTAIQGDDYTYTLMENGIQFSIIDDGLYDPDKTIEIVLKSVAGNAVLGEPSTHVVTLTEAPIVVEFSTAISSITEGEQGLVPFNMTLPGGVVPTVSLGGTAVHNVDYTYTITPQGISIIAINDGLYDPDETIEFTLTGITGNAVIGTQVTHTVTINDIPLIVEFQTTASSVNEGEVLTVLFNQALPEGVTPTVSLGGTATVEDDYTYVVNSTGIAISTIGDNIYEPNETVILTITGVSGNTVLGTNITHTVTIIEPALVVEFATVASTAGEGESLTIPFNMTLPEGVAPTVSFGGTAVQGVDYTYSITDSGINLTLIDDGVYDPNETIQITLTAISGNAVLGTNKTHTMTITEVPLVVEFQSAASSVTEGEDILVNFSMTLPTGVMPTLALTGTATLGSDYTYTIQPDGIAFTVLEDGLYDPEETIVITLTGISGNAELGAQKTHTITVSDIPLKVEFQSDASTANEGEQVLIPFTLTLPEQVVPSISFSGTATQGDDYTYTITQSGVQLTLISDGLYDPDETILMTITEVTGFAEPGTVVTHTVTIKEPALVIEFATSSSIVEEGETYKIAFNQSLPEGVTPLLNFTGTATQGLDFTYTVEADGILVSTIADGIYDPNETVIITLTGVTGNAELGTIVTHTMTLTEPPLIVEFVSSSSTATEGENIVVPFTITLPEGVVPTVSFAGTASSGTDFTYSITPTGISLSLLDDGVYDPDETLMVILTGVSGNAVLGDRVTHTITIKEDPIVVTFETASSTVKEGETYTVRYAVPLPPQVVPSFTVSGTATQGTDYTYTQTAEGFVFNFVFDEIYDPDETIVITLTGVTGNAELGSITTHTIMITEDPLTVEFAAPSSTVMEGNNTLVAFNLTLPAGVTPAFILGGTAVANADYTYSLQQNGILITAVADGLYDPDETIVITLTGISGNAELGSQLTHTVTINEPPLVVEFATTSSSVAEGSQVEIFFNTPLPPEVVPSFTLAGSATNGTDYNYSLTSESIIISAIDDGLYDPNETIIITLTGVTGNAELGTTIVHTVTLTETPLVVEFNASASSVGEGNQVLVPFTITLPDEVVPSVSLSGTATNGVDYTYTINATGILVTALNDGVYDPDETLILTLTGVSGNAVLGTQISHTVTITEEPLVVEFALTNSVINEGEQGLISFNMVLPDGVVPVVSFSGTATNGTDYTYTINSTGIQISAVADGTYDPDETIVVTLTGISGNAVLGTQLIHTVTINEPPLLVEFAATSSSVAEGEQVEIFFNTPLPPEVVPAFTLSGSATNSVDYTWSLTSESIIISAVDDGLYDPDETLVITLTSVTGNAELGTNVTHTVTITEAPLVVEFAAVASVVAEGEQVLVPFNITLPDAVVPVISLGGSATSGTDFMYSISANGILITATDDGLYDPNETIIITLTGISGNAVLGTQASHTITITEEPLVIGFQSPTSSAGEGEQLVVPFTMVLPEGVLPTISFGGTASSASDFTYQITPNGIVFNLLADGVYEPNETIEITLTAVSGNAVLGTLVTHTVTIIEPPLMVEFAAPTSSVLEGNSVTVLFNTTLPEEVIPTIALTGTATAGEDYTYTIIAEGIQFTILDDSEYDPDETIILSLTAVTGNAVLGALVTHTITITEEPLVVEFAAISSEVFEGEDILIPFNIELPGNILPTVSVGGTATVEVDYTYVITSEGIRVTATQDALIEGNETIVFTLTDIEGNAELGSQVVHTLTVKDPPFVVAFEGTVSSVDEGQSIAVPFVLPLPGGVTPTFTFTGTARIGVDYTYTTNSTGININTVNDGIYEMDEAIIITITGVSGYAVIGEPHLHTITIVNTPIAVQFTNASSSVVEGQTRFIPFSSPLPEGIEPTISISGTATLEVDYTYNLTPAGITIVSIEDWIPDPNKTVILTITEVTGNAVIGTVATHTLTITDPNAPIIGFQEEASVIAEGAQGTATFTIPLPNGVLPLLTLSGTATLNEDYTYAILPDGIEFTVLEDGYDDPDETIVITLTGFTVNNSAELGAALIHTVTITDELLRIEFAASSSQVLEGENILVPFANSLTGGIVPELLMNGTAIENTDYTYQVTAEGILIATLEDWFADPDETIEITLTGVTGNGELGSQLTHTVTILDPPATEIEFVTETTEGIEGEVVDVYFNIVLPEGVSPTLSLSGTATQGADYTYTVSAEGIAFTLLKDGYVEPDETIIITLTGFNSNQAELGALVTHTITLSDIPLVVEFAEESSEVYEGASSLIAFKSPLSGEVTPDISVGGTATLGVDYTYSVTASGIQLTVVEDWFADPDETVIFTITDVSGHAEVGTTRVHTIILNDPPATVVEFELESSVVVEGQGVTLSYNTPVPAGVFPTLLLNGTAIYETDYVYTFSTTGINIFASNDGIVEPDETIVITITGFTTPTVAELGTNLTHTVTITDTPIVIDFVSSGVRRIEGNSSIAGFSQSLPPGVTPIYSISGTATQGEDYTFTQGVNSFVFTTLKDEIYDPEEKMIIELTGFTGNAVPGPNTIYTLTIQDEDSTATARLVIDLTWDAGDGTAGDVDMDIILWKETSPGSNNFIIETVRDNVGPLPERLTFSAQNPDIKWGLSYVYYSGTSDNVAVTVNMRSYKGNINETTNRRVFTATYKLANVNPWDVTQDFQIEQYFNKSGANYNNMTDIIVPTAGSRVRKPVFILDEEVLERESQKWKK
jgi:hypothetical protein